MIERDEELGMLIEQLEVPEHGPDFFDRLDARLAEVAFEVGTSRKRRTRNFSFIGGVAAILVGILIASWIGIPGSGPSPIGPGIASASEVQKTVAKAFATVRTLEGVLDVRVAEPIFPPSQKFSFATNSEGDFAYQAVDTPEREAFRSATGELKQVMPVGEGKVVGFVESGLPPSRTFFKLDRGLGSVVRAFLQEKTTAPVQEVDYAGRPAWKLSLNVDPTRYAESPDHLDIVVDRQTGFPVDITETRQGQFLKQSKLSQLVVNADLPDGRFDFDFPPKPALLKIDRVDSGFKRVTIPEVPTSLGYPALIPAKIPNGFKGPDVAVAKRAPATGDEGMNPPSRDVLDLTYRRGLDRLVVNVYRTGADRDAWTDPISGGEATVENPTRVELKQGFLQGEQADVIIEPNTPPHLWVLTDDFVIAVSGDLTRDELITVAESLKAG